MSDPVVRVSVVRCDAPKFARLREMMIDAEPVLRPGIEAMPGLLAFYTGADEASSSLIQTSVWDTLEHARQLDTFQPMLDEGKRFVAAGAMFERPILNYVTCGDSARLRSFGCIGWRIRRGPGQFSTSRGNAGLRSMPS